MKKFDFKINGNSYSVHLKDMEDEVATIEVNGTEYVVEVHREMKRPQKTPKLVRSKVVNPPGEGQIKKETSVGGSPVFAPLPGNILQVKVQEGDTVQKGDELFVLEAMKMENHVLADEAGVVRSIKVKPGDSVLQNDILLSIG